MSQSIGRRESLSPLHAATATTAVKGERGRRKRKRRAERARNEVPKGIVAHPKFLRG